MVNLQIDSDRINGDAIFLLKAFLSVISITELLVINKIVKETLDDRMETLENMTMRKKYD